LLVSFPAASMGPQTIVKSTMNLPLFLDKADGYFNAESRESRTPWMNRTSRPFITISRESCSGGSNLAQLLEKKLSTDQSWSIFGGNVINQMLQTNHLPEQLARYLPEDTVPEVNATIGEIVGLHPSLWELVQKAKVTMQQLAARGNVILVGRGANFATSNIIGGVHVRLVAPADYRARYYARRFGISEAAALLHNVKCDAARRRYVRAHFNADIADPASYDLVINTAHVPLAEAADMVAAHVLASTHATAA
jgi:cytidylate kinase